MNSKHIFVSLDGVDGVGKTTVAKILAADGSFQYLKSPSGPFAELRKEVDAHATPLERYCFYRLATQYDSDEIGKLLKTTSVVCDRYIASTAAYHFTMDPRIRLIHCDELLLKPHFPLLLSATSEIRDARILQRVGATHDARLERDSALLDRIAGVFQSLGLIEIDTNGIRAEEVAETIRHIVARGENQP